MSPSERNVERPPCVDRGLIVENLARQIFEQPIPRQLPCDCLMPQDEYRKTELAMNPELHPAHPDHSPDVVSLCKLVGTKSPSGPPWN